MAQHGIIQHLLRQGCRKKACKQKPHAHHAQNQTVSLGTETVNMLEQERRTGQISEKGNEKEPFQKTMTHKVGIMEKMGIGAESGSEPGKTMAFGKSFPTGNTGQGQQETDTSQHIKNASPVSPAENLSSCHRSQHRRQTVNHHEGGIQSQKLSACFYIPGNGPGNDQPERAEKALHETEEKEH